MWNVETYLGPWRLAWDMTRAGLDAQAVIWMRLGGMAGVWPVAPGEGMRMMQEKPRALYKAGIAMQRAMIEMQSPDAVLRAGLRPLRKKAGKNARRLARRRV